MDDDMNQFSNRVENLSIQDIGTDEHQKLTNESRSNDTKALILKLKLAALEEKAKREEAEAKWEEAETKWEEAEAKREEAEAKREEEKAKREEAEAKREEEKAKREETEAKWDGTYLEDCDGLWMFTQFKLPTNQTLQLKLFDKIARKTVPQCYKDIDENLNIDDISDAESNSTKSKDKPSFKVIDTTDIFNDANNNERAHLIPKSHICAPKWGHSAEGAFRPFTYGNDSHNNHARKLLVMGSKSKKSKNLGMRNVLQNFIKFASHKQVFDVDPSVIIIPILSLENLLNWQGLDCFEAMVIASRVNKPKSTFFASTAYQIILSQFEYHQDSYCTDDDLETATTLIKEFLLGHAGSLVAGIPTNIDRDNNKTKEAIEVLAELEKVKSDVASNGILLPDLREGRKFRKVLKVCFSGSDNAPIPDPWLLAAKAAVNLSSTRGQKLLPACKNDDEDDFEFVQEIYEYQTRHLYTKFPSEVTFKSGEVATPDKPPGAYSVGAGAVVVTPSRRRGRLGKFGGLLVDMAIALYLVCHVFDLLVDT